MSLEKQGISFERYFAAITPETPLFGAPGATGALAERIYQGLKQPQASAPSVTGLYGEWGSGKSFWLESVRYKVVQFQKDNKPVTDQSASDPSGAGLAQSVTPLIIPVMFNAWRFEKEEHLIVPLLKTTAAEIDKWLGFQQDKHWQTRLRQVGSEFALSASAMVYSFAKRMEQDILKTKLLTTLEDAQTVRDGWPSPTMTNQQKVLANTRKLESRYFDFHQRMETLLADPVGLPGGGSTKPHAARPIRLLYLIDDLDRCLPEKAVEMLESIKLFLDIKGTAFVVAVDDEVVERGIAHRYKGYQRSQNSQSSQGNDHTNDQQNNTEGTENASPISGHEYLEKIIKLPIRIDRPPPNQMRKFIENRCPDLRQFWQQLEGSGSAGNTVADGDAERRAATQAMGEPARHDSIDELFDILELIPPIPRKLERLSELFGLKRQILHMQEHTADSLLLLRLVALQLFAPDIYRLAQRRHRYEVLARMHELKQHYQHWPDYSGVAKQIAEELADKAPDAKVRRDTEHFDLPLLKMLQVTSRERAGFDPGQFVENWQPPVVDWERFFVLPDDEAKLEQTQSEALSAASEPTRAEPTKVEVVVQKRDGVKTPPMDSGTAPNPFEPVPISSRDWRDLSESLVSNSPSRWQQALKKLPDSARLSDVLATELLNGLAGIGLKTEQKHQWLRDCGFLLPRASVKHTVVQLLEDDRWTDSDWLCQRLESDINARERALVGDLLGYLGDSRPGMGLTLEDLPNIDWVDIPAGEVIEKAQPHRVDAFQISRHCISLAQYRAFVRHADYADPSWWVDGKVRAPHDNLGRIDNYPVVNVSWYEALAFCHWLSARPENRDRDIQLPDWFQWNRAAVGDTNADYPWGADYQPGFANVRDTDHLQHHIGGVCASGLFPQAASPFGVLDLSGNVWEWSLSKKDDLADTNVDRDRRALRGGSWDFVPVSARVRIRNHDHPVDRYYDLGFRVLCSLPLNH